MSCDRQRSAAIRGALFIRLKTAQRTPARRRRDHSGAAPEVGAGSRHQRLPAESAAIRIGGQLSQESLSVHAARVRISKELYTCAARLEASACASFPTSGRHQRLADRRTRKLTSTSTATGPRRWASLPDQIENALYDAYGSARSPPSTRRTINTA